MYTVSLSQRSEEAPRKSCASQQQCLRSWPRHSREGTDIEDRSQLSPKRAVFILPKIEGENPHPRSRTRLDRRTSSRIADAVLSRNCHGDTGRAGGHRRRTSLHVQPGHRQQGLIVRLRAASRFDLLARPCSATAFQMSWSLSALVLRPVAMLSNSST